LGLFFFEVHTLAVTMRSVCLFSLIVAAAGQKHPIRKSLADRINKGNLGWKAHTPEENPMSKLTPQEIMDMMGLQPSTPPRSADPSRLMVSEIPDSFDARDKFASCKKPIRNQKHCGSCWAFAAAETLTDNLCVLGSDPPVLSPQDFVSCDGTDKGCHGGTLPNVWDYIDSKGAVSDSCMPYSSGDGSNATCPLPGCSADGADSKAYKCPVKHSMMDSDQAIQAAVMTAGAVEVGFTVMEDFMNYKSGIYKYSEGNALGGHAVKIVGWGKDLKQFYWIVQNSWGETWGENGYFRIVNWHDDMDSAIAIGGGFACVHGPTPAPPSPAPAPETCEDIVGYCGKYGREKCASMSYLIPICKKTCGCCDDVLRPSYCKKDSAKDAVVV